MCDLIVESIIIIMHSKKCCFHYSDRNWWKILRLMKLSIINIKLWISYFVQYWKLLLSEKKSFVFTLLDKMKSFKQYIIGWCYMVVGQNLTKKQIQKQSDQKRTIIRLGYIINVFVLTMLFCNNIPTLFLNTWSNYWRRVQPDTVLYRVACFL